MNSPRKPPRSVLAALTLPCSVLGAVLLTLALSPRTALAQAQDFGDISVVTSTSIDGRVNLAECEADQALAVSWTLDVAPTSDQTVEIFTDTVSGCSSATPISTLYSAPAPTGVQVVNLKVSTDLHEGQCDTQEDHDRFVCFVLDGGGLKNPVKVGLPITFDTLAPGDPVVSAVGGDGVLRVSWAFDGKADADVDGFRIVTRPAAATDPAAVKRSKELAASTTSHTMEGLENSTEYEVWVETRDDFDNWSDGSASVLATPRASEDFWERYRAGGGAQVGCASAGASRGGAGIVFAILLVGLCVCLRRRRAMIGAALLLALGLGLAPTAARAGGWVDPDRQWTFDLEVGPYLPEIDDETSNSTPYADIFGTKKTLLGRFRLERALWQGVGQVGLGLGAGFGQDVGKGLFADGTKSPDTTVFNWVPFDVTLTYRLDYGALEWDLPLVPYVRGGLVFDLWWILDGSGGVAVDAGGNRAQGGRFGFEYEVGMQLLLDMLDPMLAKDFQRSSGVDNTYLYFAYRRLQIDGFASDGFDLSDTNWSVGIAIEF